jgi:two-component system CheB/CheR fusion protein
MQFTPKDPARSVPQAEMRHTADTGHAEDERWHQRKNGSRFFAAASDTAGAGHGSGFAGIARDMTGTKQPTTSSSRRESAQPEHAAGQRADGKFLAVMSHALKQPST